MNLELRDDLQIDEMKLHTYAMSYHLDNPGYLLSYHWHVSATLNILSLQVCRSGDS